MSRNKQKFAEKQRIKANQVCVLVGQEMEIGQGRAGQGGLGQVKVTMSSSCELFYLNYFNVSV